MTATILTAPIHIVPVNDLREHATSPQCWCKPTLDDGVFIHHAMDRRELYETGALKPH